MYSTFTTECIKNVWLIDQGSHLLKKAFQKGEIYIGASFEQECFIVTSNDGNDHIMSTKTMKVENLVEWFNEHFVILSNFIA